MLTGHTVIGQVEEELVKILTVAPGMMIFMGVIKKCIAMQII